MNAAALNIVRAAFTAAAAIDPALTTERTENALLVLDGKAGSPAAPDFALFPPIMTPNEVAAVTKLSPRSLRSYAQRGEIQRAYYSNDRKKSAGYVGATVRAFVERAIGAKLSEGSPTPQPVEVEVVEN